MPCILNIETSTVACSVAVSFDGNIIFEEECIEGPSHASLLGVFVQNAITFLKKENTKPDAVAVSCGPGSYTGLRIGVSESKGLCFGLDIPLLAINTLQLIASKVLQSNAVEKDTWLCPMIDARRMEVYAAIYDSRLEMMRNIQADIVDENTYRHLLDRNKIVFFGNGAAKCKECLTHENAIFLENVFPLASDMVHLAEKLYENKKFADVAYFEPFYLKEFVATTPKNKVLG